MKSMNILAGLALASLALRASAADSVTHPPGYPADGTAPQPAGYAASQPKARAASSAPAGSPIEALFQRGLMEEEYNQNLPAAAQAYREVIAGLDTQRKMAATAVFRLGECYRKQGQTNDALVQFERVTRDFSEQASLVEMAQRRVAELAPLKVLASGIQGRKPLNPEQVQLVRQEIKLIETQLSEVDARRRMGKASMEDVVQFQTNLLTLQRQLPENAEAAKQKALVEQQIKLVETVLTTTKKKISVGAAAPIDAVPIERDILALKRELAGISQTASTAEGGTETAATDEEAKEVQRIKAIIRDSPDLINAKREGGKTPLHNAAEKGHLVVAQFLLDNHAEINASDQLKYTPLHHAAMRGHKSMVELLLAHGAAMNVNSAGGTPLYLAAENGFKAVAEVLLANKAELNPKEIQGSYEGGHRLTDLTPLHAAVFQGYRAVAELLLDHGADVNAQSRRVNPESSTFMLSGTPLHFAVWRGDGAMVSLLMKHRANLDSADSFGMTPLHCAARRGNVAVAELLLNGKADANATIKGALNDGGTEMGGYTPLHFAARDNNIALAELLLKHQAAVNVRAASGQPPLLLAAFSDAKTNLVALLLNHGADVNTRTKDGATALSAAIAGDAVNNVKVILAYKPKLEDHEGRDLTPLQLAVRDHKPGMVAMLLDAGANPNVVDLQGQTPLHWALRNGQADVAKLLLDHHANPNAQDKDGLTPLKIVAASNQRSVPGMPVSFAQPPGIIQPMPAYFPPPPPGVGLPGNRSAAAAPASPKELIELLRQYGANENLERLSEITLSRPGWSDLTPIFHKGTNGYNRYTLLELVGQARELSFPDFQKVTIHRLTVKGETNDIKVDLESMIESGDRSKNVWLEWGDVVEIPWRDHLVNARWNDYPSKTLGELAKRLLRKAQLVVKGQTNEVIVAPTSILAARDRGGSLILREGGPIDMEIARSQGIIPDGRTSLVQERRNLSESLPAKRLLIHGRDPDTDTSRDAQVTVVASLWLNHVVRNSGLLLTSSDLTRVKVTRIDPETKEPVSLVFNLEKTNVNDDLWLRDGDVIEVPERAD